MPKVDFGLSMASAIGPHGLTDADLSAVAREIEGAVTQVADGVRSGRLGFGQLPFNTSAADDAASFARDLPASLANVLVLGIGGSSLGARAVAQALAGPPELMHTRPRRLYFPDNSDPTLLAHLLETLDPTTTLALVISKSGETVETAAQLLIMESWFGRAGAPLRTHLAVVTDPDKGELRARARAGNLRTFDLAPNVGGRFSVLSPVGLVPAALLGLNPAELLAGARTTAERCREVRIDKNPAAALAAVLVLHHRLKARPLHVLMPYADGLRGFAAWYVQLWAESLGKRKSRAGQLIEAGPTPIAAVGATDQHAQVQLFMEGPRDKVIMFIEAATHARDLVIPKTDGPLSYLGAHSLAGLLGAELRGTRAALARDGRPSITVSVDTLDARSLGALFFLFEAATAVAGELYDVDAFDQPGVEAGKRMTSGLLGRAGYENERALMDAVEAKSDAKYRVR